MEKQRNFKIHGKGFGTAIMVKISTRSRKNEISAIQENGCIKIKIAAPPVDNRANIELVSYLSKIFGVRSYDIDIISGHTSQLKIISIMGLSAEEINRVIKEQLK